MAHGTSVKALKAPHCRDFTERRQLGLEDDAEGAVAHDLALGVLHLFCLSGQAVLHLLANDLSQ